MKQLFEQTELGGMVLKNRFIRSATWEGMADEKGFINERLMGVYDALSKGGAAAIVTGYAYVLEEEQPNPNMFGIYSDRFIDAYRPLTDLVHANGSRILLQVVYGGSFTAHNLGEREIWGPSAVTNKITGVTPKEMSLEDINTLVDAFGAAGRRAMASGFDGIEIHAGHGYLLNHFLSPYFNNREDAYGGDSERRARIIHDIYDAIRRETSADFPIWIKLNCSDFMGTKGFLFEECKTLCSQLSEKGVAAVEISGGPVFRPPKTEKEPTKEVVLDSKESYFSEYARDIADHIDAPVILVGGNRSMDTMETILQSSRIAAFSFSRPLLSEPDLINKWAEDRSVVPRCTSCSRCFGADGNICILDREKEA